MGIFTPESKMTAPLDMIKALGNIPFDRQNGTQFNDVLTNMFNEPNDPGSVLNMLKEAYGSTDFAQRDRIMGEENKNAPIAQQAGSFIRNLLPQLFNLATVIPQGAAGVLGSYEGHIQPDSTLRQVEKGLGLSSKNTQPTADATVEAQPVQPTTEDASIKQKDDIQKHYDDIAEIEGIIGQMPEMVQQIFRPQIAATLRKRGAPSDLVSIYSQHGGAAPAEHMKFQALMGKGAESEYAKFERETRQNEYRTKSADNKAMFAALLKMPISELLQQEGVQKDKPLGSQPWWPQFLGGGADSRNLANIKYFADQLATPPELSQVFGQQQQVQPQAQDNRAISQVTALKGGKKGLGMPGKGMGK